MRYLWARGSSLLKLNELLLHTNKLNTTNLCHLGVKQNTFKIFNVQPKRNRPAPQRIPPPPTQKKKKPIRRKTHHSSAVHGISARPTPNSGGRGSGSWNWSWSNSRSHQTVHQFFNTHIYTCITNNPRCGAGPTASKMV